MAGRNDASRLWVQENLNKVAVRRALEKIHATGRALPCKIESVSGQIVTVTFDVQSDTWTLPPVTIPIATSIYDWIPVQVGDSGVTMPSDAAIGPISGLGGNQAVLGKNPANLSSLVFIPVSNSGWTAPGGDPGKRVMQGLNGFIAQIIGGATSIIGDASSITLLAEGYTLVINSSGITLTAPTATVDGNLVVSGSITGSGSGGATMSGPIKTTGSVTGSSLVAGNGATGSFTASSGQTITVTDGIITGIS